MNPTTKKNIGIGIMFISVALFVYTLLSQKGFAINITAIIIFFIGDYIRKNSNDNIAIPPAYILKDGKCYQNYPVASATPTDICFCENNCGQ